MEIQAIGYSKEENHATEFIISLLDLTSPREILLLWLAWETLELRQSTTKDNLAHSWQGRKRCVVHHLCTKTMTFPRTDNLTRHNILSKGGRSLVRRGFAA